MALTGDQELVQLIRAGNQMLEALLTAQDIPAGVLLAVGGVDRQAINAAIETAAEFLVLAMDNCPHQFVLCGTETSIAEARARFLEQGGICQILPFKRAYHTERFEPVFLAVTGLFSASHRHLAGDSLVFLHDGRAFSHGAGGHPRLCGAAVGQARAFPGND